MKHREIDENEVVIIGGLGSLKAKDMSALGIHNVGRGQVCF